MRVPFSSKEAPDSSRAISRDLAALVAGDADAESLAFALSERGYGLDTTVEPTEILELVGLFRKATEHDLAAAREALALIDQRKLSRMAARYGTVSRLANSQARLGKRGDVQVLIYNGQSPGGGFVDDNYCAEAAAQNIGISLSGLDPDHAYDVSTYRVDDVRGNAFAAWNMGGKKDMSAMSEADWTSLKNVMESQAEPVGSAQCGATFSKTFSLSSPGVLLLNIEPATKK
jgi:hypothetical protein